MRTNLFCHLQPGCWRSCNGTESGAPQAAPSWRKSEGDALEENQAENRDEADTAELERRAGASEEKHREGEEPDQAELPERPARSYLEVCAGRSQQESREKVSLVHVRGEAGSRYEMPGALLQFGAGNYLSSEPLGLLQATCTKIGLHQRSGNASERRAAAQLLARPR